MIRLLLPLVVAASVWYGGATWYGAPYIGRETRSGEVYTGQEMTAAVSSDLWEAMKGKMVRVCSADKCIKVRVNDTGDAQEFREHGVAIDLSMRAFGEFGPLGLGRVTVSVTEGGGE